MAFIPAIAGAITAIGTAVGTATAVVLSGGAIATAIGTGVAFATSFTLAAGINFAVSYGLKKATSALLSGGKKSSVETLSSPTYSFGILQTQANSSLSTPIVYGEVKMAGNVLWQTGNQTVQRIVSFAEGEIEGFSDIRLNDIAISDVVGSSYTAYTGNGVQALDSRIAGTTQQEKAALVGGLKYEVYLALTVTANQQVNGDFNLTSLLKGKKIRVYTSPSVYTIKWSDNPVWCLADFLTGYNSIGLSYSDLDIQSFIDSAAYCDEILEDGSKRFTLNLAIDAKQSALEWCMEIFKACRGNMLKQNNKWFVFIDKPEVASQKLSAEDINDLKAWWLPMDEIFDIVNIRFKSKDHQWTFIEARAEANRFLRTTRPFIQTQDLIGVTNFNQASRLAWYYLNQSQTCQMFISFKTSRKCLNRTVGDVIELTDYILGFSDKKYRIIRMIESQQDFIEIVAREYNESIYEDILASAPPAVNVLDNPKTIRILLEDAGGYLLTNDSDYFIQN